MGRAESVVRQGGRTGALLRKCYGGQRRGGPDEKTGRSVRRCRAEFLDDKFQIQIVGTRIGRAKIGNGNSPDEIPAGHIPLPLRVSVEPPDPVRQDCRDRVSSVGEDDTTSAA